MRFEDREIVLKDGRKCILRPTSPEYADQMIEYLIHYHDVCCG